MNTPIKKCMKCGRRHNLVDTEMKRRCRLCGEWFEQKHPSDHTCGCEETIDDMKAIPRDGIMHWNGLTSEFRFVAPAPNGIAMSWVDTAVGSFCVRDDLLTYDPIRDLTPEAAAVVEAIHLPDHTPPHLRAVQAGKEIP